MNEPNTRNAQFFSTHCILYFSALATQRTRLTALPTGQPGFLQVNPGSSRSTRVPPGQPGFLQISPGSSRSASVPPGQPGFLQVHPGSSISTRSARVPPGQPRLLQVNLGSSRFIQVFFRSARVPPGQLGEPEFLQVNLGVSALGQLKIHVSHCLQFCCHYEIVYLLSVSSVIRSSAFGMQMQTLSHCQ